MGESAMSDPHFFRTLGQMRDHRRKIFLSLLAQLLLGDEASPKGLTVFSSP